MNPTVGHGKPPTWIDVAKGELAKKDKSQRLSELTSSMIRAVVGTELQQRFYLPSSYKRPNSVTNRFHRLSRLNGSSG